MYIYVLYIVLIAITHVMQSYYPIINSLEIFLYVETVMML